MLLVPRREAFALPKIVELSNAKVHADMNIIHLYLLPTLKQIPSYNGVASSWIGIKEAYIYTSHGHSSLQCSDNLKKVAKFLCDENKAPIERLIIMS